MNSERIGPDPLILKIILEYLRKLPKMNTREREVMTTMMEQFSSVPRYEVRGMSQEELARLVG